jgi:hypothetical protein
LGCLLSPITGTHIGVVSIFQESAIRYAIAYPSDLYGKATKSNRSTRPHEARQPVVHRQISSKVNRELSLSKIKEPECKLSVHLSEL